MAFLHGQRVGGPSQQLPAGTRLSGDARSGAPASCSLGQISVLQPSSSELRLCKPGVYVDPNLLGGAGWLWVNIWLISRHRELFLLSQCLWCWTRWFPCRLSCLQGLVMAWCVDVNSTHFFKHGFFIHRELMALSEQLWSVLTICFPAMHEK